MKFLYIDGKTKFFSGTKLRMWLVFAFFFFTAIAMIILELAHPGSVSDRALSLLDVTLVAAGGGGALYLGKRVVERPTADGDPKRVTPPAPLPSGEGGKMEGGAP